MNKKLEDLRVQAMGEIADTLGFDFTRKDKPSVICRKFGAESFDEALHAYIEMRAVQLNDADKNAEIEQLKADHFDAIQVMQNEHENEFAKLAEEVRA